MAEVQALADKSGLPGIVQAGNTLEAYHAGENTPQAIIEFQAAAERADAALGAAGRGAGRKVARLWRYSRAPGVVGTVWLGGITGDVRPSEEGRATYARRKAERVAQRGTTQTRAGTAFRQGLIARGAATARSAG